jgi:beta-glucosidase
VDALLAAGITPLGTLYHWDLPQALQDRQGGWASRDIVAQFAHYADVVSRCLGDRVKLWATLNEPHVVAVVGHERGHHAPGITDPVIAAQVSHHLLLARLQPAVRDRARGIRNRPAHPERQRLFLPIGDQGQRRDRLSAAEEVRGVLMQIKN